MSDGLTRLPVSTRHPDDYILINNEDGTIWVGSKEGWKAAGRNFRRVDDIDWGAVGEEMRDILNTYTERRDGESMDQCVDDLRALLRRVSGQ